MIERKESVLKEIQCIAGIIADKLDNVSIINIDFEGQMLIAMEQVRATLALATVLARIHEELHVIAERIGNDS
jgi:hypothetical protein